MTLAPAWARHALAGALAALACTAGAAAQGRVPDVPSGPAAVEGRLVHAERPDAVAGVDVLLYALSADGNAGLREGRTDAEGRFRFEGLSNAPDVVYLIGARAGEVPFGRRFQFAAGELAQRVEIELSDPLADTAVVQHESASLRVERGCTHLQLSHRHAVANPGERVVFVPEAERGAAAPILEMELPPEAVGFESLLGREGLELEGGRVRFWGPLYPGSQELEFTYAVPLEIGTLQLGFPRGAPPLEVLAPAGAVALAADALDTAPEVEIGDRRFTALRSGALPAGSALALRVETPPQAMSSLTTPRAELWVELDDAALEVNERIEVVNPEPPARPGAAPLLCLAVPEAGEGLRFSQTALDAGLRRDPSGALALYGPLPPGASQLALSYVLPATSEGAELPLRFDRDLPLLTLLVADTGVVAETDRLHRRRAVRSEDRMYLHLEAFAVEAGEPIAIGLRRTPPRADTGAWLPAGFALLAGAAAFGFLVGPLRGRAPAPAPAEHEDALELEREAIVRSLGDLEEDLDTGKLSPEDHAALRAELRARAARLLLAPREPAPATPPDAAACASCGTPRDPEARFCSGCGAAYGCPACGAPTRAADRFCAQCGAKLGAEPGAA